MSLRLVWDTQQDSVSEKKKKDENKILRILPKLPLKIM
jgi:hypothetical protein